MRSPYDCNAAACQLFGVARDEFIGRFGGGVDTYITPNVLMYVEGTYLIPKAELKDFNIVPLAFGVQYRFD